MMDLTSVLAYKSLFFANRAKNTAKQFDENRKYTALANGTRCAITTAQTVVPLFAVSECLARTATNPTIAKAANGIANSNLKNIAQAVCAPSTAKALNGMTSTVQFLTKLGLAGNIAYAAAKCLDADEIDKTEVFMQATGNCAGMYLFEKIYSNIVKTVKPSDLNNTVKNFAPSFCGKIPLLKSVNLGSVLLGIGFVAASLIGCNIGQKIGQFLFDNSKSAEIKKMQLAKRNSVFLQHSSS